MFSFLSLIATSNAQAASNVIEKQLAEIGSVQNDEVVVVQRKYTKKDFRSELTPLTIGGIPFGTVRNALFGGASYTLHINDWLGMGSIQLRIFENFFYEFYERH